MSLLALLISHALIFVDQPIDFDNQSFGRAVEINNKWADRLLAAELSPIKLLAMQRPPE